jgi:hypothetical protein
MTASKISAQPVTFISFSFFTDSSRSFFGFCQQLTADEGLKRSKNDVFGQKLGNWRPAVGRGQESAKWLSKRYGGEGGILSEHPKKFSVVMVKRKPNGINGQFDEKLFCQCHWEI